MELFGIRLYVSPTGLIVYLLLYLPLAWLLYKLLRRLLLRQLPDRTRKPVAVIVLVSMLTLPYWDSVAISYQANRLCAKEGGLHIYDTAEVEGFYGASSIEYWSRFGYRYVESYPARDRSVYRYEIHREQVVSIKQVSPVSQYGVFHRETPVDEKIVRLEHYVAERESHKKLGSLVYFKVEPGRYDARVIGLSGLSFTPWFCGDHHPTIENKRLGRAEVIKETLKPTSFQGEKRDGNKGTI